ncbi:ABC transporter substrate-binding protein [Advenella alkanexedens]|uniref:ABC transporter substrate-binding protein n=1 Tax=Advenella alkanexedens TaxID=1481665 RepID=A0ABS6NKI7_9BURK|nr:ABC transporter substrate-binding protein [Advenella alkanexedens]MBV4396132.1 ABC transporter substrate-binding protein [Advenella alkanexedens]
MLKHARSAIVTGFILSAFTAAASAQSLTVVSFGGDAKVAMEKAYFQPFEKETGIRINSADWNGEMGKIKSMVDTNSVQWDVVEVEAPELERGCAEGMFEEIDYSKVIPQSDFIENGALECGVGTFIWSVALAYNKDKLKEAPTSWADFWDVKKYPGKRSLRKGAKYTLEIALMADGVSPKDVYTVLATPEGVDRAFKKLDEIKPYIQWWESGAQPGQYLVAGDVVMSSAYNGRITHAINQENKRPLGLVWDQSLYAIDYWAIPKGSPNVENAHKLIKHASQPENLVAFSTLLPYGPPTIAAIEALPADIAKDLPSSKENMENAIALDVNFWTDYGDALEQRYNAWVAQ